MENTKLVIQDKPLIPENSDWQDYDLNYLNLSTVGNAICEIEELKKRRKFPHRLIRRKITTTDEIIKEF